MSSGAFSRTERGSCPPGGLVWPTDDVYERTEWPECLHRHALADEGADAGVASALREAAEQGGLADPGLALQQDCAGAVGGDARQVRDQRIELGITPDQLGTADLGIAQ